MLFDPRGALLPIKVVFPSREDYVPPINSGGGTRVFGEVNEAVRAEFTSQWRGVNEYFAQALQEDPDVPAVAKITLKPDALAKSHRPLSVFNDTTCPIIGGNKLGELYVSVQPQGMERVEQQLQKATKKATANISTLSKIEPYDMSAILRSRSVDSLFRDEDILPEAVRLRLFNYHQEAHNRAAEAALRRIAQEYGVGSVEEIHYADNIRTYKLQDVPQRAIAAIASFRATQDISPFPQYHLVRTAAHVMGNLSPATFPAPEPGREYGLVGIIDSGTDPNNALLQQWVAARYDRAPREYQDNSHGTFVAGLIANGRALNHSDPRFPGASCKIVDVVAFDNSGEILENNLCDIIDEALGQFPDVRVWNLSLGLIGPTCTDDHFSLFGAMLDDRAKKKNVLFVVAAGNYQEAPYRAWEPQPGLGERDRICPPADSLCAITVGSLAHRETVSTRVRELQPSPFSRRGPGPAYVMKPELSHFGGNCDAQGNYYQTGVISVGGNGKVVENIGTSFATPLVSAIAGSSFHELDAGVDNPSPPLVKAMMVHSAFLRNRTEHSNLISYAGVGVPDNTEALIQCQQSAATVILQIPVNPGEEFIKRPFPIPDSMITPGVGLQGEVFMTLLYEPPMNSECGIEYCRTNIEASLGIVSINQQGKEIYNRQVEPYPKRASDGSLERNLVRQGYKWSPLKLYYRNFKKGPVTPHWRLTLELLNRSQFAAPDPQDVILIVTLRSHNPFVPIYDQWVEQMENLGWVMQDLAIRSQFRLRV